MLKILVFIIAALGTTSSAHAQRLESDQQSSALQVLASAALIDYDRKSVVIGGVERELVFLGETHIMDPGSSARVDSVLSSFKIRGLEGYVCEGFVCQTVGFVYMQLLKLTSHFNLGSSIIKARMQGWLVTSSGELGYNGYLVGHAKGGEFELTDGLIDSMNPAEGQAFKRFIQGVRNAQIRLDPTFQYESAFDSRPQDFPTPPTFDMNTPVNLELEYGQLNKFSHCSSQAWIGGTRNCRMAANVTALLRELPDIRVLLVQTGSAHTEDLKNLIVDTP